jgi:hypothetical protein
MTMVIIRESFTPIIAGSWGFTYKTVALHLENGNEMTFKTNLLPTLLIHQGAESVQNSPWY